MPYFPTSWKVTKTQELNPSLYKPLRFARNMVLYSKQPRPTVPIFELILFESRLTVWI